MRSPLPWGGVRLDRSAPHSGVTRMSQSLRQFGGYLAGFASLFLIWHVAATYMFASVLFPPPLKVLATAIGLARDGSLGENAAVSLRRIFLGFAGGSLIGIPVGLAIG